MAGLAATNLTNVNISDTFYGVLHAGGESLPSSGQAQIYDGYGNPTALKLGANCNGATICGELSATSLSLTTPILSSILPTVVPSVVGTYSGYLTGISVTTKGIVTSVSTTQTLPLPFKAYANIKYTPAYNYNDQQLTVDFTIVGSNIQQIDWLNRGLYRVRFITPMIDTNYIPIVQNVTYPLSGNYPINGAGGYIRAGENSMIIGFKSTDFFEFACWTDEDDMGENMQACGILVI